MNAKQAPTTLLMLAALLLSGCAAGGGSPAASPSTPAETASAKAAATITIKDFGYGPPVAVAPGSAVAVTNTDSAGHTVTADQGTAFDVKINGHGGTASFTAPTAPGTYTYHCSYHPDMHGTLVVK